MGEIFGIGIEELIFIGILLALLFGPESIPRLARNAGQALNRLLRSPAMQEVQRTREKIGDVRDIRSVLARLAELEEIQSDINTEIRKLKAEIDLNSAPDTPTIAPDRPSTSSTPTQPDTGPQPHDTD